MEKAIEHHLGALVRLGGGLFWKFTSPGRQGVPDRMIVTPQGKIVFVELKTEDGRLSAIQRRTIAQMQAVHADVRVVYGLQEAEALAYELFPRLPKGGV